MTIALRIGSILKGAMITSKRPRGSTERRPGKGRSSGAVFGIKCECGNLFFAPAQAIRKSIRGDYRICLVCREPHAWPNGNAPVDRGDHQ